MNASVGSKAFALTLLLLSACVSEVHTPGEGDGIGGTGVIANNSTDGIGGTGVSDPDEGDTDGIGGTGLWAAAGDVALYGVVTSTEPLTINGHSMLVDAGTRFSMNGEAANETAMQLGSVAWVKAGIRNDGIFANQVMLQSHVRGPVEYYDETIGLLRVLGQDVKVSENTKFVDAELMQALKSIASDNRWIEVAGIRRDAKTIDASLVTVLENETTAFARGLPVKEETGNYRIGDLSIDSSAMASYLDENAHIVVTGKANLTEGGESNLQISSSAVSPALPFANEVSYYSVQGYLYQGRSESDATYVVGLPQTLDIAPNVSNELSAISINSPVVLDFEPGGGSNTVRVLRINRPNSVQPETMLIPQYKPQLPSGEFTGHGGMRTERDNPTDGILLKPKTGGSIEKTTIVPDAIPSVRLNVRPDVSVDALPMPSQPPQIRTVPPSDIVRPQLPDAQTPSVDMMPSSVGPR